MGEDEKVPKEEESSENIEEIEKILHGLDTDFSQLSGKEPAIPVTPPAPSPPKEKKKEPPVPVPPAVKDQIPPPEEEPPTPQEVAPVTTQEAEALTTEPPPQPEEVVQAQPPIPESEEKSSMTDELLSGLEEMAPSPTPPAPAQEVMPPPESPPEEFPALQKEVSEPSEEVSPPVPEEKEKEGISEKEALKIHKRISSLSPPLKKTIKDIILKDRLKKDDIDFLMHLLLQEATESQIKNYLVKIGVRIIPLKEPGLLKRKRIKPTIFDIIKHDFVPIVRLALFVIALAVLLYVSVFRSMMKSQRARSLISRGVEYIQKDDPENFKKAEGLFNEALDLKQDYYEAYTRYGVAYQKVKKYIRSEEKFQSLIKENPEYKNGYFGLGRLYREEGKYPEAIKQFQTVLKMDRNNVMALDEIARTYYYKMDNKTEALKIYKRIIEKSPENLKAHYGLLSIYIWDKDLDNVEREHYQVLKLGKKKEDMDKSRLTELAAFYQDYPTESTAKKEELFLKSEDTIQRILKNDINYSDAYYEYARLYKQRKDYRKGIINLEKAININEEIPRYYNLLGEIYSEMGNENLAIEAFEKCIQVDPLFFQAYYNLGNINYYSLDNYGRAKDDYLEASKDQDLAKEKIDLHYNLGWIFYNENDYFQSNKWFTGALEQTLKENPVIHYAVGNTYLYLQKYDLAVSEYLSSIDVYKEIYGEYPKINLENKEMVKDMETLSAIYNNLGVAYLYQGDEKQALVYFWKAIESAKKLGYSNENPSARINIQYVLKKTPEASTPSIFNEIPKIFSSFLYEKARPL
ncbi:MAG: tetratricopeptide repeat protein [Spirochaetes bacterium]|nr:tetratricopeptide repeat protein [Spirochaetota bacterium]